MSRETSVKAILFLAANPKDTQTLRLQEEERKIKERLRIAGYGKTPLQSAVALRAIDLQQAMLDFEPQVVHFSGHGVKDVGLAFEDEVGNTKLVDSEALANLFSLFKDKVECVVFNACYSEVQAKAVSQHIPFVVGMSEAIGDIGAIVFSVGFYTALGAGKSYEFAYLLGCNALQLADISESLIPVLIKDGNVNKSPQFSNLQDSILSKEVVLEETLSVRSHSDQSVGDPYDSALESIIKWARQRADEGDNLWIDALVTVDKIVVPIRRGWKHLFGKNEPLSVVIKEEETEISFDDLPDDVKNAFLKRNS